MRRFESCRPSQILARNASNDGYAFAQQYNAGRAYTANGLNQYLTAGSVTPSYDARGNMSNAGAGLIVYSSQNLMSSAPGATAMLYDPMQRLYQLTGSTTTRFLYDGTDLVAEYDTGGTVLKRYVHGPGTDEPLLWYEGSGTGDRRWLHADERGSIIAVSNGSGAAMATNAYDEWGSPQTGNLGRFQYTGQTWLPEIGLYYYKARIYNPRLGRFMQTDPIGFGGGINLYAYVANDPVNGRDPSGNQTVGGPVYDGLDRATNSPACGGDAQCGLREWNRVQQGVAVNVGIAAATDGLGGLAFRGLTALGRAAGLISEAAPTLSRATQAAMSGGENAGHFTSLMNSTAKGVQNSLNKNIATIAEHEGKIANPAQYMERGNPANPRDVQNAVNAWQRTINRAEKQADIARDVLKRKLGQ